MAALLAVNATIWLTALVLFHGMPALLGVALVVYGLGLRHAIDVDHIAAIDNVTRKLMHQGQRPVTVGFYFALGHSSIVILVTALAAWLASAVPAAERYREIAALVGSGLSAFFFAGVALVNLVLLR